MVVFDTDIIIAFLRKDESARRAVHKYGGHAVQITSFTWFEVLKGVYRNKNPQEKMREARELFDGLDVLVFEISCAEKAAESEAYLAAQGKPTGTVDNFIAATCIVNNQTLVTRNTEHFENIPGLRIETW